MGQIYSTVLTSQWSPHHSCCVCPGDQQHPCAWFQELQAWDMVHVPLQAPVVLLYKATSFLAQNKGKTPSLVSCGRLPALHRGTARPSEPACVYSHNTTACSCCASSRCRGCAAGAHAHPAQGLPSVHSVLPPPLPAAPRVNHLSHKQTTHLSLEKSISSRVTCGTSGICLGWKDLSSLADFDSK